MRATDPATGKLPGDTCDGDWIWDREVETDGRESAFARSSAAWERQWSHLMENSGFFRRRFADAGIGPQPVRLADIARLPLTSKSDLKVAIDERAPFGTNLCVPEERVKRVYQTSGTSGSPSVLALTPADIEMWTTIGTRTYFTSGIHEHHSVLSTFGAGPFVAGHTYFVLARIGCRVVPLGPGDADRVLFGMRAGIFDTLLTTPSFAQYLANRLQVYDERITTLRHIVTGGEPGGGIPAVRDHIESATGAFVNEVMGIGDIAPSLFGECPARQGMHFSGGGLVWLEMVDPDSREPMTIEPGAVGELVYTHLTREAHPVVRFLGGDLVEVQGGDCGCGRTSFRMRIIGRRDDMFIVRGVNVYPSAILAVVARFRPRVTGRARVVRDGSNVSVEPPVPVEVEVRDGHEGDHALAEEIEKAVRASLTFRCAVQLVGESGFGEASYKTRLTRKT
ncbi:MAG TPA: phenylacetate--CoA ligase family protein [Candidatus Dormibacteraeota bacterium]|nr:phenylacetate--CoA ligase family protein [Candidatus Dormibacteraeota bacterium]